MATSPQDPSGWDAFLQSQQEPDPLLRAAAESLYARKGNPHTNPEPVVNTVHWRKHDDIRFTRPGGNSYQRLVDAMIGADYVVTDSAYADMRGKTPTGGPKLAPEEKIEFHRLLSNHMNQIILEQSQEIVLLDEYRKALCEQTNDLSPQLKEQKDEVRVAIAERCEAIAGLLGGKLERQNVRQFPAAPQRGGRE